MTDPGANDLRPFGLYSPEGCTYLGLHNSFADCWKVALGWPSDDEIAEHKAAGWYCVEGMFSYTNQSPIDRAGKEKA